jgi:site-specific recombinase XerD
MTGIMPKTWNAQTIQFLTQPELHQLTGVITSKRDRAIFLLAYRYGLRASEVGMLQVADVNLEQAFA